MSELENCMKALEIIGMSRVEKSANYGSKSQKVLKAMAIARGSETPQGAVLAKRIIQLHRQEVVRKSLGIADPESDALQQLENLHSEKMEIVRAGKSDSNAIKRLQKIYDEEGDLIRSVIGED
jgi:Mg2+ and Co2+ transporter CorA